MTEEANELHRIISASVSDMISAYRIQAHVGRVSEQALEGIPLPRYASHREHPRAVSGVLQNIANHILSPDVVSASCRAPLPSDI